MGGKRHTDMALATKFQNPALNDIIASAWKCRTVFVV
jgi:hypothetical protein